MMVDTLTIARELKAADLPPAQAEAIAAANGRSIAESSATKADLDNLRIALKGAVEIVKHELRAEIERVRTEVGRVRNQLLVGVVSSQVALAGLIIALIKL